MPTLIRVYTLHFKVFRMKLPIHYRQFELIKWAKYDQQPRKRGEGGGVVRPTPET